MMIAVQVIMLPSSKVVQLLRLWTYLADVQLPVITVHSSANWIRNRGVCDGAATSAWGGPAGGLTTDRSIEHV